MIENQDRLLAAISVKCSGDWNMIYKTLTSKDYDDLDDCYSIVDNMKCKYVSILSDDYPELLREQISPPFVLFYYGDLSLLQNIGHNVAVVGSRQCTRYGVAMTKKITKEICQDYTIVSGMATGIDTVAQTTAIENGGKTIAVLGGGIDYIYPASNKDLYNTIKREHLVISEYPGNTNPKPDNFPFRNRIIAMISRGTVVTEAYSRSGTLTTVMYTLQFNRPLMCVPYPATSESECNRLISTGAYLVQNGGDVIEILKTDIHI